MWEIDKNYLKSAKKVQFAEQHTGIFFDIKGAKGPLDQDSKNVDFRF